MKVLVLQMVQRRLTVRIAIHPHQEQEPYHLPHQAMWFMLMLLALMMFLGKTVAAQWVIA